MGVNARSSTNHAQDQKQWHLPIERTAILCSLDPDNNVGASVINAVKFLRNMETVVCDASQMDQTIPSDREKGYNSNPVRAGR